MSFLAHEGGKMDKDITILEEIAEHDLQQVSGGRNTWNNITEGPLSPILGNTGLWCTATKECQNNCN